PRANGQRLAAAAERSLRGGLLGSGHRLRSSANRRAAHWLPTIAGPGPAITATSNPRERRSARGAEGYRSVATVLNRVLRLVPTSWNAAIAATAINAAIRPYSIAVAPSSSRNRRTSTNFALIFLSCKKDIRHSPFGGRVAINKTAIALMPG